MAETIYNLDQDLNEAHAMADGLVPYVYEDQLYGNAGGGGFFSSSKMPSLTIGALLTRLRRLHALESQMSDAQRSKLAAVDAKHESVRKEWTVHYNNKLVQEATSRLKAMKQFFEECKDDPRTCTNSYLPEALRRTIVQEIASVLERDDLMTTDLKREMAGADSGLRRYAKPTDFIWAKEIESVYPNPQFWWLYARPVATEKANG